MRLFFFFFFFFSLCFLVVGCQPRILEPRRNQEVESLKKELQKAKGERADTEETLEELRQDLARVASLLEERAQYQQNQFDLVHRDIDALKSKVETLEARPVPEPKAEVSVQEPQTAPSPAVITFEQGKKLCEGGHFEEAIEVLKGVLKKPPKGKEKNARFWLAESYFGNKEYAAAAVEFADFKKRYPKDTLVPKATFRQAMAFKNLKRNKEAKLFFEELIENYPKHTLIHEAKSEMKALKEKASK